MRDLKADLEYTSNNPSITKLMELAEEAVERAIKAEELTSNLQNTIQKMIDQDIEWHCEFGRLREQNDLQRQGIQDLSCQVVAYRERFQAILNYCKPMAGIISVANVVACKCLAALATPDPGVKVKAKKEVAL